MDKFLFQQIALKIDKRNRKSGFSYISNELNMNLELPCKDYFMPK